MKGKFTPVCVKMRAFLLLATAMLGAFVVQAQSTANYTFSTVANGSLAVDRNSNAIDLSTGATTLVGSGLDDNASANTLLPFDFWMMGVRYVAFSASDNGVLCLTPTATGTIGTTVYALPNGTTPTLAPFSNDMRTGSDGSVRSKVFGTAPNRTYVIEWKNNMIRYTTAAPGTGTWQVRLYEGTGVIEYVYGTMNTNSSTPAAYYVGFSVNTTANNVVTVNTTANTATTSATVVSNSYLASASVVELTSASDGSRRVYTFIPPGSTGNLITTTLNNPTNMTFTNVGINSMTVNWTPPVTQTGIVGYAIFLSTDGGTTYTYNTTVAGSAIGTINLTGLTFGTTYTVKVAAYSEGVLSTGLVGTKGVGLCAGAFTTPASTPYTYTVPAGVTSVQVTMQGGSGGTNTTGSGVRGNGGAVVCTLAVTPSTALNVYVGGAAPNTSGNAAGTGGIGGSSGGAGGAGTSRGGAGGGGSSDIRVGGTALGNRVIVAAGGGGSGGQNRAGGGGGATAGAGGPGVGGNTVAGGATTSAGGTAGLSTGGIAGTAGASGVGGGGGGGAGYFGGGGGPGNGTGTTGGGGGGGGSNYVAGAGVTGATANTVATTSGNGFVYINILSTPALYNMTGTGAGCATPGVAVGLDNSQVGVVYQLQRNGVNVGSPVTSTGGAINFGNQSTAGNYTAVAYFDGYPGCTTAMSGVAVVTITSPDVQTLSATGNGTYCAGSSGTVISLGNSQSSATYSLGINGSIVDTKVGTGAALDFAPQLTAGTYTVTASNILAPACPVSMSGSITAASIALPTVQAVTSANGGNYCIGTAGETISLDNSQSTVTYTLGRSGTVATTAVGTGSGLSFTPQTTAGTYTVSASYNTPLPACPVQMSGSVTVAGIPAPTLPGLTTTATGCPGQAATFSYIGVSNGGNQYKLIWSPTGTLPNVSSYTALPGVGTGFVVNVPVSAGAGVYTGTLTVQNSSTGCTTPYVISLTVNQAPGAITITPGTSGSVCLGSGLQFVASSTVPLTTLLAQDFSAGLTGQTGGTWTITNGTGSAVSWFSVRTPPGYTSGFVAAIPGDGSAYMEAAPDGFSTNTTTSFSSPAFSTVGVTSATLSYNEWYRYFSFGDVTTAVQYSTDGSTWTTFIDQFGTDDRNLTWVAGTPNITAALPAGALGQPTVYIRWYYVTVNGYAWVVDNIVLTAVQSPSFTWTGIAGATGMSCTNCATTTITPTVNGTNVYSVSVTAFGCTQTSGVSIFATNVAPTMPVLNAATSSCNSLNLSWAAATGATDYELEVSTNASMVGGTVLAPTLIGNVLTYTVSTLPGNTTYYYRLRGNNTCGGFSPPTSITSIATTPVPSITPGVATLCANATTTLSGSPSNGTWTSASPGIATITPGPSATAVVTGVNTGSTVINYTIGGCTATYSQAVSGVAAPPFVITPSSSIICAGTAQMLTAPPIAAGTGTVTAVYAGSPVTIALSPANLDYFIPINVSGIPSYATITDMQVKLDNIVHTFDGDLAISVQAPNGEILGLVNGRGGLNDNFINTVFSSLGGTDIASGTAPFTGTFAVETSTTSTGVSGHVYPTTPTTSTWAPLYVNPNGTWTLAFRDNANLDGGTFNSWSITIHYSTPAGNYTWSGTAGLYNDAALTSPYIAAATTNTVYASPAATATYTATGFYAPFPGCATTNTTVVNVNPRPSITLGTNPSICEGVTSASLTYSAPANTPTTYSITWDATALGQTFANVTDQSFSVSPIPLTVPAGANAAVYNGTVTVKNANGCVSLPLPFTVTVNPLPVVTFTAQAGATTCQGTDVTYSTQTGMTGYTWTYTGSSPADYTITSGGGTGSYSVTLKWISAGAKTVSVNYTDANSCITTSAVTSNPTTILFTPVAIAGNVPMCEGSGPVTLTNASAGGTWTSSNTAAVNINSATGEMTNVLQGTSTITYSNGCGTAAQVTATVNAAPAAITGNTQMCASGSAITLANTSTNGTWSGGTAGTATISATGVVTPGATQGTTTFTYANGCGSAASVTATVNATPAAITGNTPMCASGSTITLANTSTNGTWSGGLAGTATIDADGLVTPGATQGTTTFSYSNGCGTAAQVTATVNAAPAAIAGNAQMCASGSAITLANTSTNGTWSGGSAGTATISATGVVTPGATQGTTTFTYDNGCGTAAQVTATVNATPAAITGNAQMCAGGSTITLANTSTNGMWSGGLAGTATIDASGVVTPGATQGTTTFSYSNGCGTAASVTATVNATPAAITGNAQMCAGGSAITLANTSTNGTWSGGSAGTATISVAGVVTPGATQGTTTFTYDNGCGSAASVTATVNATPAAITGNARMCANGSAITLANTSTNGTWSGGLAGTATIDASGVVTPGATQGTTTFSYANGCGSAAVVTATVNTTPAAITGNAQMCVGGSGITLANTSARGTWSSSAPSVAAVGLTSGIVTSGVQGTAVITYDNGCGSATITTTVNAAPAPIGGSSQLCVGGNTLILTNSSTNGTWSGGTANVATINSATGLVTTGANSGVVTFTYTNGCGSAASVTTTVNAAPGPITGNAPLCGIGATLTLANSVTNGTWSSSNNTIASVNPNTGLVTVGTGTGTFDITYANNCGSTVITMTVNAGPALQTFTGGGGYCSGGIGVNIGLTLSDTGVNYQLFTGITPVTGLIAGTGSALSFGTYLAPGYYYAIATKTGVSGCSRTLPGVTVHVDPLPDAFAVTGGGSYCSSNPTGVDVSLSGSAVGVDYQLYESGTPVGAPVAGTGSAISFGLQLAGNYTAMATNTATGCTMAMAGAAVVDLFASPTAYNVTGGGTYCLGGSGVLVGLDGSDAGTNYQLVYLGFIPVGGAVAGTGSAFDFGTQFLPGAYTVVATNTNGCVDTMTGNATLNFSLPPAFQFVGGGGGYCLGDSGVHITLSGSATGVKYQLYRADTAVGAAVVGTGAPLDFGLFTTVGTYTVLATDTTTGCTSNMFLSATVTVNPVVAPTVTLSTGLGNGNRVCYGNLVTFTAQTTNGGTAPAYEWQINNITVPGTDTYTYQPTDGDIVWVRLTSSDLCAVPNTVVATMNVDVDTFIAPSVFIDVNPQTSITPSTPVTATAIVTNGGPAPLYQWYKNGIAIPGATNATYSSSGFIDGDSLTVRVITSGGCGGTVTFNSVVITVFGVSVPNTPALISDVRLIPNPNKGSFAVTGTLATTDDVEANIQIVDMLGQTVYSGTVTAKRGVLNAQIQLSTTLANGMYMLNLQSGTDRKVFHFVLEQ